ncbi:hypothetical protein LCGC14_2742110, partial [marine sediment metagenome]
MAQRNKRVRVQSSDRFFGTGVHAPSIVRAPRSSAEGMAESLQGFLKVGGYALALKGQADFKETAAIAQAEKITGQQRDLSNKDYGYNNAWDRLNAEDDGNRFIDAMEEKLRSADFENLTVEQLDEIFDTELKAQFAGADETPAYLKGLAPIIYKYQTEKTEELRLMTRKNIGDMQEAKLMRTIEVRIAESGGEYPYEYAAGMSNDLRDGKVKNQLYMNTLFNSAIEAGRPDWIEQAPTHYPTGQPTPTSLPKNTQQVRNATAEARNVKKARETA